MKKILTIGLALVMVLAFSAAAMAADRTQAQDCSTDDCTQIQQAQGPMAGNAGVGEEGFGAKGPMDANAQGERLSEQERAAKMEALLADLPEAVAAELESNHEEMQLLMEDNRDLHQSIREVMQELRGNGYTLTDEIKDDLKDYHQQIRDIHQSNRDASVALHDILDDIENLSDEDAIAAIDELHELRLEVGEDIQDVLEDLLKYVEKL